ncbi:MAG: hypothetical protein ACYC4L_11615 [Chloroflexota bacterium]
MRKKNVRLTTSCALIFADFPLLYYAATSVSEPTVLWLSLALLAVGVTLALTT